MYMCWNLTNSNTQANKREVQLTEIHYTRTQAPRDLNAGRKIELNLFRHNNDRVTQKVVLYKCSPDSTSKGVVALKRVSTV